MAMLVLTVLSTAAFITVESRLAMHHHLATRARLNGMVAMRLALAHLQQEAGPDRRATARADFTATQTQPGKNWTKVSNPMWTGVWRNDQLGQPPAWLISGRHDRPAGTQSAALLTAFDPTKPIDATNPKPNYSEGIWLPWQTDYTPPTDTLVTLVGAATAEGPVDAKPSIIKADPDTPGRPDGRVSLPKVALPDTEGAYAYWIGDEGVKARLDLRDPRITGVTANPTTAREAVKGSGRTGLELLPGFGAITGMELDARVTNLAALELAPPAGIAAADTRLLGRQTFVNGTLTSEGVLADSMWGGLRVDLSSLFELSANDFKLTEYGTGVGPSTFVYNPWNQTTGPGPVIPTPVFASSRALLRYSEPGVSSDHWVAPIYTMEDRNRPGTKLRGPLWEALRAHHLLYRELETRPGKTPVLNARAHFPNTVNLAGQVNTGTAHYGHLYNRMDTGEDVWATDSIRGTPAPRPTKPGVAPYVARQLLVMGLHDFGGELRLVLTPVTVLHNPYNVALRLRPVNGGDAAMRLSFRFWQNWFIDFSSSSGAAWSKDLLSMAAQTGGNPNASESMRIYIPEITLEPGELRAFSMPGKQPLPFSRLGTTVPRFDFLGGFYLPCLTASNTPLIRNASETLRVQFRSQGPFYVRHMISCWPGDRLNEAGNSNDSSLYNASSEMTELLSNDLSASRSGSAPAKVIPPSVILPGPGMPPTVLAVLDYAVRWPGDALPFPIFTRSNPMAAMTRPEATGWGPGSMPGGYATTSSSFRVTIRGANDWSEVLETDATGERAFGGYSSASTGQTHAVYTAVPLQAPLSLAEYTHANIHIRDQDPLLAAGNSFASPFIPRHLAWNYRPAQNNTDIDRSFLLNAALFDRHFLSGAGPTWSAGAEVRSMATNLDAFATGQSKLGNPRLRLLPEPNVRKKLGSHQTLAAGVMQQGAFNINSVSPSAWAAVLAGTKGLPSGAADATQPSADRNTRFPRANRNDDAKPGYRQPLTSDEAWNGLTTLEDRQIKLLAQGIVDEIRWRTIYPHRNENYFPPDHDTPVAFRGATAGSSTQVPIPFQGLGQFVNRYLCNTFQFIGHGGCLQNGIYRANAAGAELTSRAGQTMPISSDAAQIPGQGPGQTPWTDPFTRVNLRAGDPNGNAAGMSLMSEGAPGCMLQSDILEAIGPALASRSDTFILRVYAEASANGATSGTWFEAVAQRFPEFVDPGDPPETPVLHPADSRLKNPALKAANRLLGRRFKIISLRHLRAEEL